MFRTKKNLKKYDLLITEDGKKWLYSYVPCIIGYDFTGYLFIINKKKKIAGAVSLDGQLIIYSVDEKHPEISEGVFIKTLKYLYKAHFCYFDIQPFNILKQLSYDPNKAILVHQYLFSDFKDYG